MSQKPVTQRAAVEKVVKDIRRTKGCLHRQGRPPLKDRSHATRRTSRLASNGR
jgi:hypothetical protein